MLKYIRRKESARTQTKKNYFSSNVRKCQKWRPRFAASPQNVVFLRLPLYLVFVVGNPDILICGNCRELFSDLVDMLDHKKNYCKMRFTCKCETDGPSNHISEIQCQNTITNTSGNQRGREVRTSGRGRDEGSEE